MIPSIGRTIQSAMSWPTMDLAELARSLAGPFNDDYNQFHSCYQCHGSPLGKVYVNTPWPAFCFDVDNEVVYLKQDSRISNKGWQSEAVNDPVFDNLTHYWSMDEASGTRMDSKGSWNLSDPNSVPDGSGISGNAADISSTSTKQLIAPAAVLTSPFSISFWFKQSSAIAIGDGVTYISKTDVSGGGNGDISALMINQGGVYTMDTKVGTVGDGFTSTGGISLNNWHLAVVTVDLPDQGDGTNPGVYYIDGAQVDGGGCGTTTTDQGFTIGHLAVTAPAGLIDEVGIFNVALSPANVTTLWNGGIGKFYRP